MTRRLASARFLQNETAHTERDSQTRSNKRKTPRNPPQDP
jgi:hypothetical protein